MCEPFTQWVLEDRFNERPPLEEAGVQLVDDVEPYELMKLRLLNASHQALCYFGYPGGYRLVHEVCQDPLFADFLLAYMDVEATPTLEPVPGVDLDRYKPTLIERFSNGQVRDTVARLCAESSDRIPKWLLPVIQHNLAAWWRDDAVGSDCGQLGALRRGHRRGRSAHRRRRPDARHCDGRPLGSNERIRRPSFATVSCFGDIVHDERFMSAYLAALDSLHSKGARRTLEELMAGRRRR